MNFSLAKTKQANQAVHSEATLTKSGFFSQPMIIKINRFSLFIVFFWFGILKVFSLSPAEALVSHLHEVTISSLISKEFFVILLGYIECLIGVLWLMPRFTKPAFILFTAQMFTTFLPMIFLPKDTWQNDFVLTLTGQYIIKNLVLIASALTILSYSNNKS
jgi:uncharacterized membrane protein YkgB